MKYINVTNSSLLNWILFVLVVVLLPDAANATTSSGTSWDAPLTNLTDAITGPVAYTISLLSIVVAGAMLAFGGEINEFARRMIMVVLVIALVVFAAGFLSDLWGTTGAIVDAGLTLQPTELADPVK